MCFHSVLPDRRAACSAAFTCLPVLSAARSPGLLASERIYLSPSVCLHMSHSTAKLLGARSPVRAFTCLPACAFMCPPSSPVRACTCLPARAFICLPVLPDRRASLRIYFSPSACRHLSCSAAKLTGACLKVCAFTAFPACAFISLPVLPDCRAACSPVWVCTCLLICCQIAGHMLASVRNYLPPTLFISLPDRRAACSPSSVRNYLPGSKFLGPHARQCQGAHVLVSQHVPLFVLLQDRWATAHQRVHVLVSQHVWRVYVFFVGAQAFSLSAYKSVPCWRRSVSIVGAQQGPLSAHSCVHCRRTRLSLVGASSYPASAHTSAPDWHASLCAVAAQECYSLAHHRIQCRRRKVFVARAKVFFAGECTDGNGHGETVGAGCSAAASRPCRTGPRQTRPSDGRVAC